MRGHPGICRKSRSTSVYTTPGITPNNHHLLLLDLAGHPGHVPLLNHLRRLNPLNHRPSRRFRARPLHGPQPLLVSVVRLEPVIGIATPSLAAATPASMFGPQHRGHEQRILCRVLLYRIAFILDAGQKSKIKSAHAPSPWKRDRSTRTRRGGTRCLLSAYPLIHFLCMVCAESLRSWHFAPALCGPRRHRNRDRH